LIAEIPKARLRIRFLFLLSTKIRESIPITGVKINIESSGIDSIFV
jgi:hypothetical protein